MRSSPSPSAWDEAYHTRQPLLRSLWLAASSSSWASPDCGHWWFASSRKVSRRVSCQWWGKRMEKRGFFFEVVWGCADFFSAISAIQTSYRPNFWWPTGEPRYWCWCWPLSVLHRIPKLRRHLFNNFNRCTWGFLRTWTEWSHKPNTVIIFRWSKGIQRCCEVNDCSCLKLFEAEGMGLSVADPATLVTLNSLSPSNYDSAKSLGLTPSMSVLGKHNEYTMKTSCFLNISESFWIILNPYCQETFFAVPTCSDKSPGFKAVAQHCSALRHCYAAWPHSWWTSTGGWCDLVQAVHRPLFANWFLDDEAPIWSNLHQSC